MVRATTARKPRVRSARGTDRDAVAALFAESERMHARWHPSYFRGDGRLDSRLVDALDGADEKRALFVVANGATVLGFVHVELLEPKPRNQSRLARRGHVDVLVVAPSARREGCGRALLDAAADWARERGAAELLLTVWAGNVEAERFYTKLGMRPVSRVLKLQL